MNLKKFHFLLINSLTLFFILTTSSCEIFGYHAYIKDVEYVNDTSFLITYGGETSCLEKDCVTITGTLLDGTSVSHSVNTSVIQSLTSGAYYVSPEFQSEEEVVVKPTETYWTCDSGHSHRLTGYKEFTVP